ncbi:MULTISPECIES: hypothetical protein [Limnospira]|jgi:hypothetical protein|uniref:Uncharacterized protein n=1 Tax=Limnospira platensis NIES-46 TaxID=1236695 RepID=A0A5M3TE47_LIMPL|nr:hypothetical protein [Arthrospira platensis]MDF2213011.1 hypothetical protein [Arthrospira platensis NCB002]MDT9181902.1 hypothetical protein [Limnospira sp. PMC 289.06]MDT9295737.1 hypothetical protein [Arthrospira platensis PCC 7345]BAI91339.1 hypothetical protein NIES39_J02920 [Arthrospira platensis NIES-39]BDT13654.1 hypothetical protein N39L_33770 [Arthrospira platensis NIES-39]
MSNSDIQMSESDFFICVAFHEMLGLSGTEEQQKLDRETAISIADYLTKLPPEDKLNPAAMANHITAFCQQPGNEQLKEWFGEIYDRLDEDGIDKLVKKTGDPGKKAYGLPITGRDIENEGRDACQDIQKWATEIKPNKDSHQK